MDTNLSLKSLPVEIIVHVLLYLSPKDIYRCQRICQRFRSVVRGSSHLQYLLKLDLLGYSEPLRPRTDLNYDEKLRILNGVDGFQTSPGKVSCIDLDEITPGFSIIEFCKGVFAFGYQTDHGIRRFTIFQLASTNAGTATQIWHIPDLGVSGDFYRIDPDLDLLVVFQGQSESYPYGCFHIRSLRTGSNHLLAAVPIIEIEDTELWWPYESFRIIGKYIALIPVDTSYSMTVWDWTTGEVMAFPDLTGNSYAFVSDCIFIVPSTHHEDDECNETLDRLQVYTFDPERPNEPARHAASLQLPEGVCSNHAFFLQNPLGTGSFGFAPSTVPPRVYDTSPSLHFLQLVILDIHSPYKPRELPRGSLFFPASVVLEATSSGPDNYVQVQWKDWAHRTYWINRWKLEGESDSVLGGRAAFLRLDMKSSLWEVLEYELGSCARSWIEDNSKNTYELSEDGCIDNVFLDTEPEEGLSRDMRLDLISLATTQMGRATDIHGPMINDEYGEWVDVQRNSWLSLVLLVRAVAVLEKGKNKRTLHVWSV